MLVTGASKHEKAPPKRGSIAPDVERSAKVHCEVLKLAVPIRPMQALDMNWRVIR